MNVKIEQSWKDVLSDEFNKDYFIKLTDFIRGEYLSGKRIFPEAKNIFNAFNLCPLENVKVVIIGQDPYHEPGQAHQPEGNSKSLVSKAHFTQELMRIGIKQVETSCCSVAQSCLMLCDPVDCSTLGLPVHHSFPESTQTHVH